MHYGYLPVYNAGLRKYLICEVPVYYPVYCCQVIKKEVYRPAPAPFKGGKG